MENLQNLFSKDYPTVELHSGCKIIGPVTLPIKIQHTKAQMQTFLFAGKKENSFPEKTGKSSEKKRYVPAFSFF